MKKIIAHTLLCTILATSALSTSVVIAPDFSPAISANIFQKIGKDLRKAGKGIRKEIKKGPLKKILPIVGTILIANGIADGSPAAIIFGAALIAAPQTFQKDMAKKYGKEMQYSGCTSCGNKRVVLQPGQKITTERERAIKAQVRDDIKDVQKALAKLEFYTSKIDGDYGPGSRRAAKKYQAQIGTSQTGILNAEERYLLFTQAAEQGYVRETRELQYEAKVVPASFQAWEVEPKTPVIVTPTIAEFRLAKSQFTKFSKEYLESGDQSIVSGAELLPDGKIKIQIRDDLTGKSTELIGTIAAIDVAPHQVSDLWIRVTYSDDETDASVNLNTRDDFDTIDDASKWMNKAKSKIGILAQLTEVEDQIDNDDTLIADKPAEETTPIKIADAGTDHPKINATEKIIADDGPKIAGNPAVKIAKTEIIDAGIVDVEEELIPEIELAKVGLEVPSTITVSAPHELETCRQSLFVDFDFPVSDKEVSHFSITPPDGAVWFDQGDTTSHIIGQCVQGTYSYEYVSIKKGKTDKDWKDAKFTGQFQIASNSESCSINLDDPTGSAGVHCFQ